MPEYKYRGILRNGKIIRGIIVAKNHHEVITRLKETRIQPIMVKTLKKQLVSESKKKIDHKKLEKIQKDVEKQTMNAKQKRTKVPTKNWLERIIIDGYFLYYNKGKGCLNIYKQFVCT